MPISIVWCQIETLVVWKFLRAVKNLLSAFFCWFFTLYIEIHIKKNNVNKSLADRHTFQYIYFCRKGRQFYLMDFFCVLFVLLWEDMSNKYAPESRAVWYRSIFFWKILFHSYFENQRSYFQLIIIPSFLEFVSILNQYIHMMVNIHSQFSYFITPLKYKIF